MPNSIAAEAFVSTATPTARQRSLAFTALAIVVLAYGALLPFSSLPLVRIPAYIPAVEGMASMVGLLTAVFLYNQFSITRSRAMLVLASAYVFAVSIALVRIFTFPGVFSPAGLLGAGPQTAAWLYIVLHFGFPVAVCSYIVLKDDNRFGDTIRSSPASAVCLSLLVVIGLVVAVTWIVTAGDNYLPRLVVDGIRLSPFAHDAAALDLSLAVLTMLLMAIRQTSLLDRWLMVSLGAMTAELTLVTFFMPARYSLGFYASGVYTLVSLVVVLAALHTEVARKYSHAVQALVAAKRDRENKLLSVRGATGVMAHEVKQPLAAIAMEVEAARGYLRQRPPNLDELRESLDAIGYDALRANDVIAAVRSVLKRDRQDMKHVDLNEIVSEALSRIREEFEAHAITVELSWVKDLPKFHGHRDQLLQVLMNVLRNAVEALEGMANAKRVVRIETGLHGRDRIFIKVQDSGPGIDPKIEGEIFNLFQTTKSSGMGLGLALCRLIVEQHGGEIVASSAEGAQFQIFLPAT